MIVVDATLAVVVIGVVVNTNWLAAAAFTVSTCVAEVIAVGEKKLPFFKVGKELKEEINNGGKK